MYEYACHEGNYGMEGIMGRCPRRGAGVTSRSAVRRVLA